MAHSTIYDNPSFQHILMVTEEIILEKGCRNTTLRDIIERSGLSKGAIYHYVDSKDELFGIILKSKIEEMNNRFQHSITDSLENKPDMGRFSLVSQLFNSRQNTRDIGNLIFIYLLSQDSEKVKKILHDIYFYSKNTGAHWIKMGQDHGVIPTAIDAEKMAMLLMTFSFGLRVTQILAPTEGEKVNAGDIFNLIVKSLS